MTTHGDNPAESPTRPSLVRRVRMRWDAARETHVLLVPEGVLLLNEQAAEVLTLCDGTRTQAEVVVCLCERYPDAPPEVIAADVRAVLDRLRGRGFVQDLP